MATYYLDVDDEITTAAARIRKANDQVVAIVLPAGSRVATSRINFRLLAREAQGAHRRLVVVAPEGSVRALAASAGLPVFSTVGEYEAALAEAAGADAARRSDGGGGAAVAAGVASAEAGARGGGDVATALDELGRTIPEGRDGGRPAGRGSAREGSSARAGTAAAGGTGVATERTRKRRRVPVLALLLLGVVAIAAVGAGVGAYLYLPSATIVVTPRYETIGPLELTVRVDPATAAVQPAELTIPGAVREFPEQAANTFPATGKRVDKTRATGSVTMQSCDTANGHVVPRGTVLSTVTGVRFTTDRDVQLARATINPIDHSATCGTGSSPVTAVTPGVIGNVAAGAVVRFPAGWDTTLFYVQNPAATSGGTEVAHTIVQQSDIDKSKPQLEKQVQDAFDAEVASPALPTGLQLFPETAKLGEISIAPDPATLVGKEMETFQLVAKATGTALAANTDDARTVAQAKVEANVGSGYTLERNSVQIAVGTPVVNGDEVTVPVAATGQRLRQLNGAQMVNAVKGKTAAEAKALLAQYGDVRITLWPDWVSTVPTNDSRLDFQIGQPPAASRLPAPSAPSGGASGTAQPSASGSGSSEQASPAAPSASESAAP